jgi:hypothetical protein
MRGQPVDHDLAGEVPPRLIDPAAWPLYSRRFEQQSRRALAPLP